MSPCSRKAAEEETRPMGLSTDSHHSNLLKVLNVKPPVLLRFLLTFSMTLEADAFLGSSGSSAGGDRKLDSDLVLVKVWLKVFHSLSINLKDSIWREKTTQAGL